jgi:hypothetical protein
MQRFNSFWFVALFLFGASCKTERATRNANNGTPTDQREVVLFESEIVKTIPRYKVADPDVYGALQRLSQAKPDYSMDTGLGQLASVWATILVDRVIHDGMDGEQYMVSVYNEYYPAQDGGIIYRIRLMSLSHVVTKQGNSVTHGIGYYISQLELDQVLSLVCKNAGIKRPNAESQQEQIAPSTIAYFSSMEKTSFTKVEQLARSAQHQVINEVPVATIGIASVEQMAQPKFSYRVELFMTPGQMRIALETYTGPGATELRMMGYVTDIDFWKLLRNVVVEGSKKLNPRAN